MTVNEVDDWKLISKTFKKNLKCLEKTNLQRRIKVAVTIRATNNFFGISKTFLKTFEILKYMLNTYMVFIEINLEIGKSNLIFMIYMIWLTHSNR